MKKQFFLAILVVALLSSCNAAAPPPSENDIQKASGFFVGLESFKNADISSAHKLIDLSNSLLGIPAEAFAGLAEYDSDADEYRFKTALFGYNGDVSISTRDSTVKSIQFSFGCNSAYDIYVAAKDTSSYYGAPQDIIMNSITSSDDNIGAEVGGTNADKDLSFMYFWDYSADDNPASVALSLHRSNSRCVVVLSLDAPYD